MYIHIHNFKTTLNCLQFLDIYMWCALIVWIKSLLKQISIQKKICVELTPVSFFFSFLFFFLRRWRVHLNWSCRWWIGLHHTLGDQAILFFLSRDNKIFSPIAFLNLEKCTHHFNLSHKSILLLGLQISIFLISKFYYFLSKKHFITWAANSGPKNEFGLSLKTK